jgi:chromosome segregation ATPase
LVEKLSFYHASSKQSTISASENQSNSKEVRQLEQKLRKREEQLKIKEAILNENTNDRTQLLDQLYQAETRNLELEQTLKTLNQKIYNTGQKDLDTSMGNNKESCDEIILGIREKITRFVLSKVDYCYHSES